MVISISFMHKMNVCHACLCIGECPSNYPFLKNNGAEGYFI